MKIFFQESMSGADLPIKITAFQVVVPVYTPLVPFVCDRSTKEPLKPISKVQIHGPSWT